MKKIVALLLGLLMVFGACSAMAETATAKPGDVLSFDISISSPSGTDAKIGIKTNGAPVTFKDATGGPANDVVPPKSFDGFFVLVNVAGIEISGNGGSISGTPTDLVTLESGKIGTVTFTVSDTAVAGQTYTVEAYKKDGSITVEGSITFTVAGTTTGNRVPGDANDDGVFNVIDVLLVQQKNSGWNVTINADNADVNRDGAFNVVDVLMMLQKNSGWNVTLQ